MKKILKSFNLFEWGMILSVTLFTIYFVVDRVVEILFLCFTGIGTSYWGPIQYTFVLACPVFAFLFSGSSKFVKNDSTKISFFYFYCIFYNNFITFFQFANFPY